MKEETICKSYVVFFVGRGVFEFGCGLFFSEL